METQKSKKLVLGDGEVFGHKHVLQSDTEMEYEILDECLRIQLRGTGVLTHDEHDRMVFGTGDRLRNYHQVEFNPMDRTVSRVFD